MVTRLDPGVQRSLARGVAGTAPGALSAMTVLGGIAVDPGDGVVLRFGRNRPSVDLCVGEDDLRISRVHGVLNCRAGVWSVQVTGRSPVRLGAVTLVHADSDPVPLSPGYTPLFLSGSSGRVHVLELHVTGLDGVRPVPRPGAVTVGPRQWRLTSEERLALVALGQRYLDYDPAPQPLSRAQAAEQLAELQPGARWTTKKVEYLVSRVRQRLSNSGVCGLRRDEVGEPVGLTLAANLLRELITSTTLVPLDLTLLDRPPPAAVAGGYRSGPR